jgi:hypothetical protein
MRKILLATTALVALGGVSAASADISLSGSAAWQYKSWSDTAANTGGANDTDQNVETDVKISMSNTTDSGLTITAFANMDEAAATGWQDKGFTIGGDWGTLGFAGSESGDAFATSADVAADEANTAAASSASGNTGLAFDGDEQIPSAEVSFKSPSVNGFTFTLGYTDGGSTTTNDATSFGLSYSTSAGGASVVVQAATASVDDSTGSSSNDYEASSTGVKITSGDLGLTLAQNTKKIDTGANYKYKGTGVGLTYKMSDTMSLALHNKDASNDADSDYSYEETAGSVTYTIASGVVGYLTYTDWSLTDNANTSTSGNYTHAEVKVSF